MRFNAPEGMKTKAHQKGFRVDEFVNPSGGIAYRVHGWRQGTRIRENYPTLQRAEARRLELENERLGNQTPEVLRATWLTGPQLKACEWAAARIPDSDELRRAVDWWVEHGRTQSAAASGSGNIGLDDAAEKFAAWVDSSTLRDHSKRNLKIRVGVFASETGDVPIVSITPETVESWLQRRKVSPVTRDNDRRAVARFLGWCCERPRRWLTTNPAREVRVDKPERGMPEILTLRQTMRFLIAAKRVRGGLFLKWAALGLFGGLRPFEAIRFRDSDVIDGHLRIEAQRSKVKRTRVIEVPPVLAAWIKTAGEGPVANPSNHRRAWESLLRKAKITTWVPDVLRHTSLSHTFRRLGSYGLTSEHGGTSEQMVKAHYQARTSIADSEKFWSLFPDRKARRAARQAIAERSAPPKKARTKRSEKEREAAPTTVVPFPAVQAA